MSVLRSNISKHFAAGRCPADCPASCPAIVLRLVSHSGPSQDSCRTPSCRLSCGLRFAGRPCRAAAGRCPADCPAERLQDGVRHPALHPPSFKHGRHTHKVKKIHAPERWTWTRTRLTQTGAGSKSIFLGHDYAACFYMGLVRPAGYRLSRLSRGT